MSPDDLDYLAQFLRRRAGIVVAPHKASLIESRLGPVARRFGFRHVDSLLRELRYAREGLARAVTEAMTTNDSSLNHSPPCFCSTCWVASRYEPLCTTGSSRSSSI